MALPDYFLQELKSRLDIADVISSYVNLKRSGKNLVGLCPFHNEKTPSFSVSRENGFFHCFGCGAGGDVISFIRKIENLDYIEAVKLLADRAGLQMPESGVDDSMIRLRTRVLEINRETARFYNSCLMSDTGKKGLEYFTKRGLSPSLIKHFGLGYSPDSRFALVNRLSALGFTNDEMVSANVAFISRNGKPIDRFASRVMFPIIDLRGNVVAFGGRILTDEKPKYINTSDTPVYHKSSGLFAMNFAKENKGQIILAEGYMDVISLHGAGFTGAIASLGTSLTTEQARIIARYTDKVIICYDMDEAGQKATQRAIPILRAAGLKVKVVAVPGGKDPDEYIRSGGKDGSAKFKALIEGSGNDVEYRLSKLRGNFDLETSEGKIGFLTAAVDVLGGIENSIERDVYAGKLSEELSVNKSSIIDQIEKTAKKNYREREKQRRRDDSRKMSGAGDRINPDKIKNPKVSNAEECLIAYILLNPDGARLCSERLEPEKMRTEFNRRIYTALLQKAESVSNITLTDLSGDFTQEEMDRISRMIALSSGAGISKQDALNAINIITSEGVLFNADSIKNADMSQILDALSDLRKNKA